MRIAVLSDLHLISPSDPSGEIHEQRAHFALAWPSVKRICAAVRRASPDLVISLGDMVDWYSNANRDFAIEMLEGLRLPWLVTPGNHDFEMYRRFPDGMVGNPLHASECEEEATRGWKARGIELGNRSLEVAGVGIVLLNSACSTVPEGTREWLDRVLPKYAVNLVFTHTPFDIPPVRQFILTADSARDMKKYVQSGAPSLFETCLRGRVRATFSGHLHFPGNLCVNGTEMYFLGLSAMSVSRDYPGMGRAMILDLPDLRPQFITDEGAAENSSN